MAVLAQWTFPSNNSGESGSGYQATTTGANITASDVTRGGGSGLTSFTIETLGYGSDPVIRILTGSTDIAGAISNSAYVTFNIAVATGYTCSLSSLTFNNARGGSSTPRGDGIRSSIDGYTNTLYSGDIPTQRATWTGVSIDLTGASYQSITGITFRAYCYAPTTGASVEFDDITINGSVDLIPVTRQSTLKTNILLIV